MKTGGEIKTEAFKTSLQKAVLPYKEEFRQKCRNESVIGGFDKYVIKWIDTAAINAPAKSSITDRLKQIKSLMGDYPLSLPYERKKILKESYSMIMSITDDTIENGADLLLFKQDEGNKKKSENESLPLSLSDDSAASHPSLQDPVEKLTGVGSQTAAALRRLSIVTIEDLFYHLPKNYIDTCGSSFIGEIEPGKNYTISGTLDSIKRRSVRKNLNMVQAVLYDHSGSVNLVWFNKPYLAYKLKAGHKYLVSGKVSFKYQSLQIDSPQIEVWDESKIKADSIIPVYPAVEGISQNLLRKIIQAALKKYSSLLIDIIPQEIKDRLQLYSIKEAILNLHMPKSSDCAEKALYRIKFEEAFLLQLLLAKHRRENRKQIKGQKYTYNNDFLEQFEKNLDFRLTDSQRKVIDEILKDMLSSHPMNRLLQGDVGSGKTIVCIYLTLIAALSGYQTAVLAPTEILAEQHFHTFNALLNKFEVKSRLLIGATDIGEKVEIKNQLQSGELKVVVGTHALLQENVYFKNLTLAIVDEQHKFGVMQRTALKEKGRGADFLFLTATPIPRSLCLTLYGDLDISLIDQLPPDRHPVKTILSSLDQRERVYSFIERELEKQGQVFIVCPLIDESEKMDLTALNEEYERVVHRFPQYPVGLIHGRMKAFDKEKVMKDFAGGFYRILTATTVVEVGVDIPNASVMAVLDAQRFGLGQLHQLRGRVGRSRRKSTCILVSGDASVNAKKRLNFLTKNNSGFDIAEEDLRIRGPGEIMGFKQAGIPELKYIDMIMDYKIIKTAKGEAILLEGKDPELSDKKFLLLKEKLHEKYKSVWDIIH